MARTYSGEFNKHKGKISDKWGSYLAFYDGICKDFEPTRILEIGVQNGGSLEVWAKLYPAAEVIVGVDIDENCGALAFREKNIRVVVGDIKHQDTKHQISQISEYFDLIVDDGSHKSPDIVAAVINFLPLLRPGGRFVIEDLHASYWDNWDGGLFAGKSAMKFLMRLIDVINFEHWNELAGLGEYLEGFHEPSKEFLESVRNIKKITFENSLCMIEMAQLKTGNSVGERLLVGSDQKLTSNAQSQNGQSISNIAQRKEQVHPDAKSYLDPNSIEELILTARQIIEERDAVIASLSWRITKPARKLLNLFKK